MEAEGRMRFRKGTTKEKENLWPGETLTFAVDEKGKLLFASSAFFKALGISQEKSVSLSILSLVSPRSRDKAKEHFLHKTSEKSTLIEFKTRGKGDLLLEVKGDPLLKDNQVIGHIFVARELLFTKEEALRKALFKIATESVAAKSQTKFFRVIHRALEDLLPSSNFYIAFYDPDREVLNFPYYKDQLEGSRKGYRKIGKGLTERVLFSGKPLLLKTKEEYLRLVEKGELEAYGSPPESWLGMPLTFNNRTYGALVVQSYNQGQRYNEGHLELFSFVSHEISSVILRFQLEESERQLRQDLSLLFEHCPDPIYLKDIKGRYLMVNPAFEKTLNLPATRIIGKNAFDFFNRQFAESISATDQELLQMNKPMQLEEAPELSGHKRFYETIKVVVRDRKGKPIGILGISRDFTDRKVLEEGLEKARMDLLYAISHELKAPLSFLFSAFEILGNSPSVEMPQVFHRWEKPLERNLKRLKRLVDNLVDALRLKEAEYPVSFSPSDFPELIREIWEDLESYAQSLGVQVSFEIGEVPVLEMDREAMGRVVANLLSNSLKYSPRDSTVYVRLFTEQGHVALQVEDRGMGIPYEELDSLFQPFYRTEDSRKKSLPGTGLGLYVSRKIVEAHGGTLTLESEEGKGTRVTVRLPVRTQGAEIHPEPGSD